MKITAQYIARMLKTLLEFHSCAGEFINNNGSAPAADSQALLEQATFARPESIVSAFGIGIQLLEYGAEHLTAFVKIVTEPAEVIACWTCVRSMLESCAIAAWLFDPSIGSHERVGRVFAHRFEGLEQQIKFGLAIGKPPTEIDGLKRRMDEVERSALELGYSRVLDRRGKRNGIGQRMPGATEIVKLVLGEEHLYRLSSSVAHGHHWAIIQLGFSPASIEYESLGGVQTKAFQKSANLPGIALLGSATFLALARPLWNQCQYFGWPQLDLEEILEDAADKLRMTANPRFWRSSE